MFFEKFDLSNGVNDVGTLIVDAAVGGIYRVWYYLAFQADFEILLKSTGLI